MFLGDCIEEQRTIHTCVCLVHIRDIDMAVATQWLLSTGRQSRIILVRGTQYRAIHPASPGKQVCSLQGEGEVKAPGGSRGLEEGKEQHAEELADAKRKFMTAAKRKQGEHSKKVRSTPWQLGYGRS